MAKIKIELEETKSVSEAKEEHKDRWGHEKTEHGEGAESKRRGQRQDQRQTQVHPESQTKTKTKKNKSHRGEDFQKEKLRCRSQGKPGWPRERERNNSNRLKLHQSCQSPHPPPGRTMQGYVMIDLSSPGAYLDPTSLFNSITAKHHLVHHLWRAL